MVEQIPSEVRRIALLEAELAADPLENKIALRRANLERDAAYLETQWMEIGTAIEAEEAKIGN